MNYCSDMFSKLKKIKFSPLMIGLILFIFAIYPLRPVLWPGGTGISDTLDKLFWGNTLKIERNEAILSKTNEAVISKTVEKDKKGNIVKTIEINKYDDGKTLWDWLSLLGVPLSLAILGYFLQQQQQKRLDNETKEEVLQTYFDRLSVLLIDRNLIALSNKLNLNKIEPEEKELLDSALDVIRARTLSILRRFENDAERKTSVISFLIETEIVGKSKLNLSVANLSGANLSGANLSGTKLKRANLKRANLEWANLKGAKLIMTNLSETKLEEANLEGATLIMADLSDTNLEGAKLQKAKLQKAKLQKANLEGANLEGANLQRANLQGAKLRGAYLKGSYLKGANLKDIEWNSETVWPDKSQFTDVQNIPEELKKELGITP